MSNRYVEAHEYLAAHEGEVVLLETELPDCCRRSAYGLGGKGFSCPSCGAVWLATREASEDIGGEDR
jgi:hypothetical protein